MRRRVRITGLLRTLERQSHHWQTLILLVPLLHNPDEHG
jgi:hypothetical protein